MTIANCITWLVMHIWRFLKRPMPDTLPKVALRLTAQYTESKLSKLGIAPKPEYIEGLFLDLCDRLEDWKDQGKSETAIKMRVALWLFSLFLGMSWRMLDKSKSKFKLMRLLSKLETNVKAKLGFLKKRDKTNES